MQVFVGLIVRFNGYHTQRGLELTRLAQRFGVRVGDGLPATHLVACTYTDGVGKHDHTRTCIPDSQSFTGPEMPSLLASEWDSDSDCTLITGLGFLAEAGALHVPSLTTPLALTNSIAPPLSCITVGISPVLNSLVSDKLAKLGSPMWHNHTDPFLGVQVAHTIHA